MVKERLSFFDQINESEEVLIQGFTIGIPRYITGFDKIAKALEFLTENKTIMGMKIKNNNMFM